MKTLLALFTTILLATPAHALTSVGRPELEVLSKTDKKVVVEFYLPTCPWCKRLAPIMEDAAKAMKDKATFVAVNCDEQRQFCIEQDIPAFPTVIIAKGRKMIGYIRGYNADEWLIIQDILDGKQHEQRDESNNSSPSCVANRL